MGVCDKHPITRDQRGHMLTQERGNLVIWNMRTNAETTDAPENHVEAAEEESPTSDAMDDGPPGQLQTLLGNIRADQNIALAAGQYSDANQLQQAIMIVLDCSAGPIPEGFSPEVLQRLGGVFQRLHRYHRNRRSDERAERFRLYVENMTALM